MISPKQQADLIEKSVLFFTNEAEKLLKEAEGNVGRRKAILIKKFKAMKRRIEKELEFLKDLEK